MKKKKASRLVEKGTIHITATFNNTIVTISDEKGQPLVISSCGMYGFAGTRKSTPYAATVTTDNAIKKAIDSYGILRVDICVKGIGPGREAAMRVIKGSDLDIEKIVDMTPVPHNGVRPPKVRRV